MFLGFVDGLNEDQLDVDKVGGYPFGLLNPTCCEIPMPLLVQFYTPDVQKQRCVYVFNCNNPKCLNVKTYRYCPPDKSITTIDTDTKQNDKLKLNEKKVNSSGLFGTVSFDDDWDDEDVGFKTQTTTTDLKNLLDFSKIKNESIQKDNIKNQVSTVPNSKWQDINWSDEIIETSYQSHYLYFEPYKKPIENYDHENALLQEYLKSNPQEDFLNQPKLTASTQEWEGENYESLQDLNVQYSKTFKKFQKIMIQEPEQCLRYEFNGLPVWYTDPTDKDIPNCSYCGSPRVFEFQLMPYLRTLLSKRDTIVNVKELVERMDWTTIIVYVCTQSCFGNDGFVEEHCVVQADHL